MLDLWAALSPLSPQYMYVTVPEAVQCGIFGTAEWDAPEWSRANTLWAPTMDVTMSAAPKIIHHFFT
jgi:hypothetical protein